MGLLRRINPAIAAALVVVLVAGLVALFWPHNGTKYVYAEFPRTVSLYEGSAVKILGITVGKVETVTPAGTVVKVKLSYDDQYKVPADAKAAVISPSIVGDRFVQLTPVYKGGDQLRNNAHLGVDRTATPLELDEIFGSINDLDIALGPNGANKSDRGGVGPLTRVLDSTARNFGGQGVQFNHTLKNLGAFTKTLADNKQEFFGSLTKVEQFTNTLAKNDNTVRRFNDSLKQGADLLASERQDLAKVLKNLSIAMTEVRTFVKENRASLSRNISGLNKISKILVKRRDSIAKFLRYGPAALNNLFLAGNVKNGTLDTRTQPAELFTQLQENPASTLCAIVGANDAGDAACKVITQALTAKPRVGFGKQSGADDQPTVVEPIDRTLGGLVEVSR